MKKQIPILFSTPMVQAILEGRKTQTRRIIKNLVIDEESGSTYYLKHKVAFDIHNWKEDILPYCPYGITEDLLWVRETTKVGAWNHEEFKVAYDYKASPELTKTPWCEFDDTGAFDDLLTRLMDKLDELGVEPAFVDEENETFNYKWEKGKSPFKWTPSIHMPKIATRIWLEVVSIRVERLHDISPNGAVDEGINYWNEDFKSEDGAMLADYENYMWYNNEKCETYNFPSYADPVSSFMSLWEKINGTESLKANPWVWVIEFKKADKPND